MEAVMLDPGPRDGRAARRHRNREAVLDAVIDLFTEDNLTPGVHEVARRSGVSLRSVYRYFDDVDDLVAAAIARHSERSGELFEMPDVGEGPTCERIHRFCARRVSFFTSVRPVFRATTIRAGAHRALAESLDSGRERLRCQTEEMFRPELAALAPPQDRMVASTLDTLSQFDALEYQYRKQSCDAERTTGFMVGAFTVVLS